MHIKLTGKGNFIKKVLFDRKQVVTSVIPVEGMPQKEIQFELGHPEYPYVLTANSILEKCIYNKAGKNLTCILQAFEGHATFVKIISPNPVKAILLNGQLLKEQPEIRQIEEVFQTIIKFQHKTKKEELIVQF
jgi:hypothetical protein